jgi:anti-sigma regulatory factor (Ser/Thr protein kinase)
MATVEMSFTPLPVHVRTARLVATAVARRSGVQEALLDEVRLAVGEACSRAVEAHRVHCPAEPVRIELTGTPGRFEVVVTDAAARDGAGDDEGRNPAAGPGSGNGLPGPGSGPGGGGTSGGDGPGHGASGGILADAGYLGAYGSPDDPDDPESLLPQGLGLAVIAGLADDVTISRTAAGLSIRMSWPSGDHAG